MSTAVSTIEPQAAAAQFLTQLATGHIVASALQTVLRLGIPDRLSAGPRTASELAREAGVREDTLYRVLRALASVGVLAETAPRRFALAPAGQLLVSGAPGSMRDMALWITSPFHFRVYAELMHSIETGQPAAEKVTGMPVFDYFRTDPAVSRVFNDAMTNFSEAVIRAALDVYDFSGIKVLVDVAGGHGAVLTAVLNAYPRLGGVLFDLDHVVEGARARIDAMRLNNRCRLESGDMFAAVPAGGDAYIMKHIIHDWDDERAVTILRNIRTAMGSTRGRVILLESVLQPGNAPDFGKILDLEMMAMPGGRERTADEFRGLFASAGFAMTRVIPTESPLSIVEAVVS
jgi:DNA-binding phage protein